jgi:hypothetical protein
VQQARNSTTLHFTGVTLTKAGGFNFVHLPSGGLAIGLQVRTAHDRLQLLIGLSVREGCAPCKRDAFQWVQAPPGNRSSRKQSEQSLR